MPASALKMTRCIYLLISVLCLINGHAFAASDGTPKPGEALYPRCGGLFNLCGYSDRSGREFIPKTFEETTPFSEGLAAVRLNGLYGYVDALGEMVIPPRYDRAGPFYNNLAEIVIDGKAGIISRQGDIVLEPQFARSIPLTANLVFAQPGSQNPEANAPLEHFRLSGLSNKPGGLYHLKRGWLTPQTYAFSIFDKDNMRRLWARDLSTKSKYGLMSEEGTWLIPPTYDHVQMLSDGRAVVAMHPDNNPKTPMVWGAVDADGKVVIPLKYEWLSYWQGYGVVREGTQEGFLSRDGDLLGGRLFQKVRRDGEGRPFAVQLNDQWFGIDAKGTLTAVPPEPPARKPSPRIPEPMEAKGDCHGGASYITRNGFWGLKDPEGRTLIEPKYEAISCFHSGIAWAPDMKKGQWCPLGPDGQPRSKPACKTINMSGMITHASPEMLDPDPFLSNVLWFRKRLNHKLDPSQPCARIVGDGSRGGNNSHCLK